MTFINYLIFKHLSLIKIPVILSCKDTLKIFNKRDLRLRERDYFYYCADEGTRTPTPLGTRS